MNTELIKKKILDLAIRGRLVEQRPEEGTAEELYAQIQEEKKKLIEDGKIKKEKPLPEITEDEIPFDIPESWKWVRLGTILRALTDGEHKTPVYTTSGVPFLSVKDISSGYISFSNTKFISEDAFCEYKKRCNPEFGDILLSKVGTTGIPAIVDTDKQFSLFVSVSLLKLTKFTFNKYLYWFILSPLVQKQANENTKGVGNKNWVLARIAETIIPLPPLSEQKRIVEKVKEIFSRIDVIEKAKADLSRDGNLLEKKILDLAIRGKLVEQRPEEGTAEELYAQIQEEKKKLIAEGKIKKEKPLTEITEDEIPFEIPNNWKWVRLNEGMIINPSVIADDEQETSFIPMADVESGYSSIINLKEKRIWKTVKKNFSRFENGDVLIAKITPCFQNRKSAIAENLVNGVGAGTTEFNVIRTNNNLLLNKFVLYFAKSEYFINYGQEHFTGTVGQQRFSGNAFYEMLFPLPPLAEQKRIVTKIEELLPYCDKLK